ncbi:hypothetical protein CHCC20375_2330 [Bacillus licheniformis]|nr:hypothetical protein CHCC20375_2330 [Bacillus licheniformis]
MTTFKINRVRKEALKKGREESKFEPLPIVGSGIFLTHSSLYIK